MTPEILLRGAFSGSLALTFAWVVFSRQDDERDGLSEFSGQRYTPYIGTALLPLFFLMLLIGGILILGLEKTALMLLSAFFCVFLSILLYYPILLLALPVLRRHISARACATLWLIPNYLYIMTQSIMEVSSPLFMITLKGNWIWVLLGIWFAGFAGILGWKLLEHIRFRRYLLADAHPVTEPQILDVWNAMITDAGFQKPKFKLVTSPAATTPLTVGLLKRSTRVVLPMKPYSDEELALILRHELVHIGREDAWSKFFMVFCTAMCWFNPLMWIAMRKSADDTELSCDETVLLNADDATRKRYALLLLNTAGDERGFTTCLSATANAMRYRLQRITKPSRRRSGALIVGAAFFMLAMTSGYVALAYDGSSGTQVLYRSGDYAEYSIRSISRKDDAFNTQYEILDESAFHSYLAGLTLFRLAGSYSYTDSEISCTYVLDTPQGTVALELHDNVIKVVRLYGEDPGTEYFYVPEGLNWDYINSILIAQPACNVQLYNAGDTYGRDLDAFVRYLWKSADGERILLQEGSELEGESHGIFGDKKPCTAVFSFSQELARPFTVLVETWDREESYTLSPDDFTMELPDYPAHYTITASFRSPDGTLYEAEFWFQIGDIGNS